MRLVLTAARRESKRPLPADPASRAGLRLAAVPAWGTDAVVLPKPTNKEN